MADLKEKRAQLLEQQSDNCAANQHIADAVNILSTSSSEIIEWDESIIRQLVDTVKVLSADRISIRLQGGMEIEQELIK